MGWWNQTWDKDQDIANLDLTSGGNLKHRLGESPIHFQERIRLSETHRLSNVDISLYSQFSHDGDSLESDSSDIKISKSGYSSLLVNIKSKI